VELPRPGKLLTTRQVPPEVRAALPEGTIPSPNIWDFTRVYEIENAAVDPDGVLDAALTELRGWAGADVLDIGCGTGYHLPRFAATARTVTGIEPHPRLARLAARRTAALPNVTVRQGTAQALGVPDSSVDLAHARWAYFFGPGAEPGLAELARVCRRGGAAAVLDHDATRSSVGRWFAAGLPSYDAGAVEAFWARHGFSRRRLDVRWVFADRDDLAAVLRIEFGPAIAERALAEHDGVELDAAMNLWFRKY
jgi:SAM-dependent methyltransferase